ncbi:MAG: Methyltransferase type 11 [Solirubrobacterales bacterium]|jgi:SAM-dependent methyltransferase|nr:Methyltransferase type 11 [Solirubrobacterales bacterium]
MHATLDTEARSAYDALAPAYDALTAEYPYAIWLERLVALAREHGLRGERVLDLACGTGNSFLPLLEQGFAVTAADVSPAMCAEARRKAPGVAVHEADMRALPVLGAFDLVTCIDDSLNYLLEPEEVLATFRGVAAQLAPGGLFVFDVNTLRTHRETFSETWSTDTGEHVIVWRGTGPADLPAGGRTQATVDTFSAAGPVWTRTTAEHRQRNHPPAELLEALAEAGLEAVALRGQRHGAVLDPLVDELAHNKVVVVARARKEVPE